MFYAGLHSFATDEKGGHTAKFYIMNTSRNRNRWGVTDQSLEEALPTLKGAKIGMGAAYKIDKHYPDDQTMDSGVFISYEKPGAYALGTANIEDQKTFELMKAGKIGPVSVVIHSFRDTCSKCAADLSAIKDPFNEHDCLKTKDAYAKVESFRFKRVDFVDVPAYPQAGVVDLSAQSMARSVPLELLASFYELQPTLESKAGVQNKPNKPLEETLLTEIENIKIAELEKANAKLTKDLEASVAKASANETQVTALKASLDKIQKDTHQTLVNEVYEARSKAGIAGKVEDEKTLLTAQSNETLTIFKADAQKVAAFTVPDNTPKTKYTKTNGDTLDAAVKEMRANFGFAPTEVK